MPYCPPSPSAVETLYLAHHGWLQAWLRKKLGNSFDAADLAQDTFIRILSARNPVTIDEPRAYLTTVARGVLINWYKRQALERAYLDAMLDALQPVARKVFLLSQLILGSTVANLRLAYQATPEVNLAMNVNNVFDKRYWQPGYGSATGTNNFGDPRNVMFTLKL